MWLSKMLWKLVMLLSIATIGLLFALALPAGEIVMPYSVAFILGIALLGAGFTLGGAFSVATMHKTSYERRCPQCARIVPIGDLACGPCGYSFVTHSVPQAVPQIAWPASPVKLPQIAVEQIEDELSVPQSDQEPSITTAPIAVPNALAAPLMKRAKVGKPGPPAPPNP